MTTLVRRFKTRWHIIGLVLLLAVALPESTAWGQQRAPAGFSQVAAKAGVELYWDGSVSDDPAKNRRLRFVQVVNLSQGASVKLPYGSIADPGAEPGPYGGDNPTFRRQPLQTLWNSFASDSKAFCLSNGAFFSPEEDPTPLAFSLKTDGMYVSDGYAVAGRKEEYPRPGEPGPNKKLMLEIWKDRADIKELTKDNLYNSDAPNIIGGLREDADKGKLEAVGRTFVGVQDANGDDRFETILIFNSGSSTQPQAASTLRSFGAGKVMMLDGGGSTQLICEGKPYVFSSDLTPRYLPQTLAVSAAPTWVWDSPQRFNVVIPWWLRFRISGSSGPIKLALDGKKDRPLIDLRDCDTNVFLWFGEHYYQTGHFVDTPSPTVEKSSPLLPPIAGPVCGAAPSSNDRIPASGTWISPDSEQTLTNSVHFAAHAYDNSGGSGIAYVNFTAWWPSLGSKDAPWKIVCPTIFLPTHNDVYECEWNFSDAPPGDIHVSFDVYDKAGNYIRSPNGERIVHYTPLGNTASLAGDWELKYEIYRWLRSDRSTVDVGERATIVARFSTVEKGFTGRYLHVSGGGCINAEINGTIQGNQVKWKTHFTAPPCQGAEVVFEGTLSPDGTTMTGTVSPIRTSPDGRGAWARVTARKVTSPSVWLNYVSFPSAPHASVAGTKVTATGSGWSAGHKVSVQWGNTQRAVPTVDDNGGFTVSFIVPEDATEGQHTVHFYDVQPAGGLGYSVPVTLTVLKPDIPSLKARVTELLLFESGYDPPPADQRVYQQRFASDATRYINWELNLEYPAPGQPRDFQIMVIWYQDNGTGSWEEVFRQTLDASIEGDWTESYHNLGYGCDDPVGCWGVGSYRVDVYIEGNMIASAPFQIYAAAL